MLLRSSPQRGGHIPGASNIPWLSAVNESDGTFKSVEELSDIYGKAVKPDCEVIPTAASASAPRTPGSC